MIFKKSNANSDFIMAMGKKAGNLKEPPGGSSKHTNDKKAKMATPVKNSPVPPVAKKKKMTGKPVQQTVSQRQTMGALGAVKCAD